MKHSKVVPLIVLKKETFSIIRIAEMIVNFYKGLSEEHFYYSQIYSISEKKPMYPAINTQEANSIQILAEEILHQNIDDIRKIDGVDDPGVNYCREEKGGISIGLQTKIEEDTFISLNFSFYLNRSAIGSIVVNETCLDTYLKANMFLEIASNTLPVDYSVVKIMDRSLNKIAREYVAPLGWITYFSNSYENLIPDDLEGISYEYTDNGKKIILSKEDISIDPCELESSKLRLIDLMKQIEIKSPAYSKAYIPPTA